MKEAKSGASSTRHDLQDWLVDALKAYDGTATIVQVCHVWKNHEEDLRSSGNLFFTWQYDIRWAATKLRKQGVVAAASSTPTGTWALTGEAQT